MKIAACWVFSVVFYVLSCLSANAADVIIKGNNPDYAGETISIFAYNNQITSTENELAKTKVDSSGNFEWHFSISQTRYVFIHAGIYFVFLYAQPGMVYTVKLPPRSDKTIADKLNPYFEETKVHLVITDLYTEDGTRITDLQNELNFLIRTLDDYFNPFIVKYAYRVYTEQNISDMDSAMVKMEHMFGNISDPYFKQYYFYRFGYLKFTSTRFKSRNISANYFLNRPVLYDNPAYMELFNQVYDKYFNYLGRDTDGKKIYTDINKDKSYTELKETLRQVNDLADDSLTELVILKGLHDGFYEMEFSRSALLQILDSLILTTKIQKDIEIANDIRQKVTKLLVGYAPPQFQLYNQDSVLTTLADFKGKFVYLFFCTTQNYACIKQYDYLTKIYEKFKQYVEIVTISVDDNFGEMRRFIKKTGYSWTFLNYGNQPSIIKEYDLRTLPTCYLIDRDGKLISSPAPLPTENLELHLFNILRSQKIL